MGGSQREMFHIHQLPTKIKSLKNLCQRSLAMWNINISLINNAYVTKKNSVHALPLDNKIFFRAVWEAGELSHIRFARNNVDSLLLQHGSLSLTRDSKEPCNTFILDRFSCRCIQSIYLPFLSVALPKEHTFIGSKSKWHISPYVNSLRHFLHK